MKSLQGKRVVVTRAPSQLARLTSLLSEWGAEVVELPLIEVREKIDPDLEAEVFKGLAVYEWVVFTSANGVRYFFDAFFRQFSDLRCLGPCRIGCVGKATQKAVQRFNLEVDLAPKASTALALGEEMLEFQGFDSVKVLVVTGNRNGDELPKLLEDAGRAIVDTFPVYETVERSLDDDPGAADFRAMGADWITFTSGSTVEAFVRQAKFLVLAEGARKPKTCSIGPVTSEIMRKLGLPVDLEVKEPSVDAMVDAMVEAELG
ncbi:MAG: uroporphyrinogen-III synthase [Puniceicoccaceae bacterium]